MKNKNTGTTSADGLLKLKLFGTDKDALSVVRSWADCTINMAGCGDWSGRDDTDRSRSSTISRLVRRGLSPSLATVAYSAPMARSRAGRCRQADGDHFRLSTHSE
jgi:hypothetical protein